MAFLKHPDSLYIGGEFVKASDAEAVINPADESLIMMAPVGNAQLVGDAIGAAREAFDRGEWPRLSQAARMAKLTEFLDAIDRRKAEFSKLPTFFTDVDNSSRLAQEEVFGPIGAVIGFETDDEAIAIANDSDFGLAGGIYSANVGHVYQTALQIRAGGVGINGGGGGMSSNAPFGGIKRSGYGREYGVDGLNEFTYIKSIAFHGG